MVRMAKSPERPRDDLRPKSGDSLKVHTIKYSRAAAIKAVYHATVSRKASAFQDGAGRRRLLRRWKRRELSDTEYQPRVVKDCRIF